VVPGSAPVVFCQLLLNANRVRSFEPSCVVWSAVMYCRSKFCVWECGIPATLPLVAAFDVRPCSWSVG